jgi:hypothetical protein
MLRIRNPKVVTRQYYDSPTIRMHSDGRHGDDARLDGCRPTRAVGASELDDEAFTTERAHSGWKACAVSPRAGRPGRIAKRVR